MPTESSVTASRRQPSDSEIQAAGAALEDLSREAAELGARPEAAGLHYAMGHVYGDLLGDPRSAAVCYQNAFQLDPGHRPTLEAARQLFLAAGRLDKVLALHEREEALLSSPPDPGAEEVDALLEDALRKLHSADAKDPIGVLGLLQRARARNDWEAVSRLCRERAERTGGPSERVVAANVAAHRLGKVAEAMAELRTSLEDDRRDQALLSARASLAEQQRFPELADALRAHAAGSVEPTERADLKVAAAALLTDPLEKEHLLSEALADNPGDAAAIAQHARLLAQRDPLAAAERFAALA